MALTQTIRVLLTTLAFTNGAERLRCPLSWESVTAREDIPLAAIVANAPNSPANSEYIIRSQEPSGTNYFIGRLVSFTGYIPTGKLVFSYDILTNPLGCEIAWEPKNSKYLNGDQELKVGATKDTVSDYYVGRFDYVPQLENEGMILAGQVDHRAQQIVTALDISSANETKIVTGDDYWVLLSYSLGVGLEIRDFETQPFPSTMDFMGLDELHNYADTVISQTVIHRKKVMHSTSMTSESNFAYDVAGRFDMDATINTTQFMRSDDTDNLFPVNLKLGGRIVGGSGSGSSASSSYEREFHLERTIIVEPHSAVQVKIL